MKPFRLKEFKFSEQEIKVDIAREYKLKQKIKFCLDYLIKHLSVNKLDKDNKFDFSKLAFDEGKNYDWYFLNNEKTTLLIRQYGVHFTFFAYNPDLSHYQDISVFTIHDNRDKMDDDLADSFCDDPFQSISEYLPELIKMIEKGNVHSLWNDYSFKVPKYTDVNVAMSSTDSIASLDTLMFACDEIFSLYVSTYALHEVVEDIKKYNVGDTFGEAYTVTKAEHELNTEYPYSCGLELKNNNFPDSKPTWCDVYTLAMYHSDDLIYDEIQLDESVMKFLYQNHDTIMIEVAKKKDVDYYFMSLFNDYTDIAYELYSKEHDMESNRFFNAINKNYRKFVEMSFRIILAKD